MSTTPTVNKSLAIMLAGPQGRQVKLVRVTYDGFDDAGKPMGSLTLYKTTDTSLRVKDLVIVPTADSHRVGFTTARVAEINVLPDFETRTEVKWLAGKFDTRAYDDAVAIESNFLRVWQEADRRRREEELKQQFLDHLPVEARVALLGPAAGGGEAAALRPEVEKKS